MSIVLNGTDRPLRWSVSIDDPIHPEIGQELTIPPRFFTIEPGQILEVPDKAYDLLIHHLGPLGLVRYDINAPLEPQRRQSRRQWLRWGEKQLADYKQTNRARVMEGRPEQEPGEHLYEVANIVKMLQAEFKASGEDLTKIPLTMADEQGHVDGLHDPLNEGIRRGVVFREANEGAEQPPPAGAV